MRSIHHRHCIRDEAAFNVAGTCAGIPFEKAVLLVEELRTEVPIGWEMAAMAERWILDHGAVTTVIAGACRAD